MLQTAVETEFGLVTFFKSKGATVSLCYYKVAQRDKI